MKQFHMGEQVREVLRASCITLLMTLVTLIAIEIFLRVADIRILQESDQQQALAYRYDAELGWTPIPNSVSTAHIRHNSLGLRDIEFKPDGRRTILFIGDSFVWGAAAEADERFTDLLRARLPEFAIVNAGVAGYGTDQEYLLLKRIWGAIQPTVVVLIFCAINDRMDNTGDYRNNSYKPYFATDANGALVLRGQPVPKSRQLYIKENWWVQNLWLARLAVGVYLEVRHPRLHIPDPTERLVTRIREFVEAHGAKLLVGLQASDDKLMKHLTAERIPFVTFDGAEALGSRDGIHWGPRGHELVADRLQGLFTETGIVPRR